MAQITIHLPSQVMDRAKQRAAECQCKSLEQYILQLVKQELAAEPLSPGTERILVDRLEKENWSEYTPELREQILKGGELKPVAGNRP